MKLITILKKKINSYLIKIKVKFFKKNTMKNKNCQFYKNFNRVNKFFKIKKVIYLTKKKIRKKQYHKIFIKPSIIKISIY